MVFVAKAIAPTHRPDLDLLDNKDGIEAFHIGLLAHKFVSYMKH